jgi:DEAD/DEAH box helicase domain-containing protein
LAQLPIVDSFETSKEFIQQLTAHFPGKFLVFADSRKQVETLAAACRQLCQDGDDEEPENDETSPLGNFPVLPYRAGLEASDSAAIQQSLKSGMLKGVICTSAMELGVDIGAIDLVVMLNIPATMKSFWQRLGRTGRKNGGICLVIDSRNRLDWNSLRKYLSRPTEINRLYLQNRYAQYSHALCAAAEIAQINGSLKRSRFSSLPAEFTSFLENELNPTQPLPADLYTFKQDAQDKPHYQFPLRTCGELEYKVKTQRGLGAGELTQSQLMKEAYPGAVYMYMAKPYRVLRTNRHREIIVASEKYYQTQPIIFAKALPDFKNGIIQMKSSRQGFIAEVDIQVLTKITGFKEKRGPKDITHNYGVDSQYSQNPLVRFIRTTGVCLSLTDNPEFDDDVIDTIRGAYCTLHGIQSIDVGVCLFHSDLGRTEASGIRLYDNTNGSLRLTSHFFNDARQILEIVAEKERNKQNVLVSNSLQSVAKSIENFTQCKNSRCLALYQSNTHLDEAELTDWQTIIAPEQTAILHSNEGPKEVYVMEHVYTPKGLMYRLKHAKDSVRWMVESHCLEPIAGTTHTLLYNCMTGECREIDRE